MPVNYEIDPMSGFKQYPYWDRLSKLRQRWDGQWVRSDSLDPRHPQDFIKSRGSDISRNIDSPEPDDNFISTSIAPEDL